MEDIVLAPQTDVDAEIARIAALYQSANGPGLALLNQIGSQADGLLDRLPQPMRDSLTGATAAALGQAVRAAETSRRVVPDQSHWVNRAVSAGLGAAGGFGGLPSAMAELPVTTTFLLRVIQGVARDEGFDPSEVGTRFDCVQVFASAGPFAEDDDAEIGFVTARMALQGAAMKSLIARVAPRLATVLGQKLAAQSVPLLGAFAGATTNVVYTQYYTDMARVHFALRRLSGDSGVPPDVLRARLARTLAS